MEVDLVQAHSSVHRLTALGVGDQGGERCGVPLRVVQGVRCKVYDVWCIVNGAECRVQGAGCST